jgi:hypothetical protein
MSVFIFITVLLEIDNPAAAPVDAGPRISLRPQFADIQELGDLENAGVAITQYCGL